MFKPLHEGKLKIRQTFQWNSMKRFKTIFSWKHTWSISSSHVVSHIPWFQSTLSIVWPSSHIDAATKCLTFYREHFQIHLWWRMLSFYMNTSKMSFYRSNWQSVSIYSRNGSVPNKRPVSAWLSIFQFTDANECHQTWPFWSKGDQ